MSDTFYIKRGDTSPSIKYALDPETTDLTGASVLFKMRSAAGVTQTNRAGVIITATGTPTVQYNWISADTADAGTFSAEFQITYASGAIETFPNSEFITVQITPDI